jgi:hypothetical protein
LGRAKCEADRARLSGTVLYVSAPQTCRRKWLISGEQGERSVSIPICPITSVQSPLPQDTVTPLSTEVGFRFLPPSSDGGVWGPMAATLQLSALARNGSSRLPAHIVLVQQSGRNALRLRADVLQNAARTAGRHRPSAKTALAFPRVNAAPCKPGAPRHTVPVPSPGAGDGACQKVSCIAMGCMRLSRNEGHRSVY